MRSLEFHNKYPDCLWMQLEAIPVSSGATDTQQLDLYVSLNFNEHWEPVLGGRVKLGLQGGTLRLNLENCEIPLASRQLVGSFNLLPIEEAQQNQSSTEASSTEIQPGVRDSKHPKELAEIDCNSCHVSTLGDDASPVFVFELERGKSVLKGLLQSVKLGEVPAKPCRIEAVFEVSKEDIYLTDTEGLWLAGTLRVSKTSFSFFSNP